MAVSCNSKRKAKPVWNCLLFLKYFVIWALLKVTLTYPEFSSSTGSFGWILCSRGLCLGRISVRAFTMRVSINGSAAYKAKKAQLLFYTKSKLKKKSLQHVSAWKTCNGLIYKCLRFKLGVILEFFKQTLISSMDIFWPQRKSHFVTVFSSHINHLISFWQNNSREITHACIPPSLLGLLNVSLVQIPIPLGMWYRAKPLLLYFLCRAGNVALLLYCSFWHKLH